MTAQELRRQLDAHISKLVVINLDGSGGWVIYLGSREYQKAKYTCTEDEKDFKFKGGIVTYKGFELKKTK